VDGIKPIIANEYPKTTPRVLFGRLNTASSSPPSGPCRPDLSYSAALARCTTVCVHRSPKRRGERNGFISRSQRLPPIISRSLQSCGFRTLWGFTDPDVLRLNGRYGVARQTDRSRRAPDVKHPLEWMFQELDVGFSITSDRRTSIGGRYFALSPRHMAGSTSNVPTFGVPIQRAISNSIHSGLLYTVPLLGLWGVASWN